MKLVLFHTCQLNRVSKSYFITDTVKIVRSGTISKLSSDDILYVRVLLVTHIRNV